MCSTDSTRKKTGEGNKPKTPAPTSTKVTDRRQKPQNQIARRDETHQHQQPPPQPPQHHHARRHATPHSHQRQQHQQHQQKLASHERRGSTHQQKYQKQQEQQQRDRRIAHQRQHQHQQHQQQLVKVKGVGGSVAVKTAAAAAPPTASTASTARTECPPIVRTKEVYTEYSGRREKELFETMFEMTKKFDGLEEEVVLLKKCNTTQAKELEGLRMQHSFLKLEQDLMTKTVKDQLKTVDVTVGALVNTTGEVAMEAVKMGKQIDEKVEGYMDSIERFADMAAEDFDQCRLRDERLSASIEDVRNMSIETSQRATNINDKLGGQLKAVWECVDSLDEQDGELHEAIKSVSQEASNKNEELKVSFEALMQLVVDSSPPPSTPSSPAPPSRSACPLTNNDNGSDTSTSTASTTTTSTTTTTTTTSAASTPPASPTKTAAAKMGGGGATSPASSLYSDVTVCDVAAAGGSPASSLCSDVTVCDVAAAGGGGGGRRAGRCADGDSPGAAGSMITYTEGLPAALAKSLSASAIYKGTSIPSAVRLGDMPMAELRDISRISDISGGGVGGRESSTLTPTEGGGGGGEAGGGSELEMKNE